MLSLSNQTIKSLTPSEYVNPNDGNWVHFLMGPWTQQIWAAAIVLIAWISICQGMREIEKEMKWRKDKREKGYGLWWLVLALVIVPVAYASPSSVGAGTGGSGNICQNFTLTNIAAVSASGNIDACTEAPGSVANITSVFFVQMSADAPGSISGTTTFTWSGLTATGCTTGTETKVSTSTAATSGSSDYFPVTMTSNQCRGVIHLVITAGATPTTLLTWDLTWNTIVPFINGDNQERFCAASIRGAICANPTVNAVLSGGITTTLAGQAAINVCSSHLGQCNGLYVNGTQALSGTVAISQSGTWTVTNAGGQTVTLSGALTIHQDPLSGTVAVTNSGGQTITFNAAGLNLHPDQACGATIYCLEKVDSNSQMNVTLKGNVTTTTNALAFDWSGFLIKYFPLGLTLLAFAWYWKRNDPIYGIVFLVLDLADFQLYPFSKTLRLIQVAVGLYVTISMLYRVSKVKGGLKIL